MIRTAAELEELFAENPEILMMDNHINALLGVAFKNGDAIFVYDRDTILRSLASEYENDGEEDPETAALEWMSFNIEGAYVGPHTPLIVEEIGWDARVYLAQRQAGKLENPRDPEYWEKRGRLTHWPFRTGT